MSNEYPPRDDYYTGPVSDHFDGTQFFNPWHPRPKKGWRDVLKWRMEGNRAVWPESIVNEPRPPLQKAKPGHSRITFIGHATFLVETGGKTILIDPVFSERASPFSAVGPKRVRPPFVSLNELPPIDVVFVSHNHYDHLDLASLAWLARNRKPLIVTPLGNSRHMKDCVEGCHVMELDWHQKFDLTGNVHLTVVPAQHWSRRGLNDINRDLWGGCIIDHDKGHRIYYCGDSGFDRSFFTGLGQHYPNIDIALLSIGAYEPRWFMSYSHMNPEEAVDLHQILKPRKSVGFHFETFQLTDEAVDAPRKDTQAILKRRNIPADDFLIPSPGDVMELL